VTSGMKNAIFQYSRASKIGVGGEACFQLLQSP